MILTAKRMDAEQTARAAEASESEQSDDDGGVDEATAEGAAKGKPHGASLGRSATEHSATHDSRNARAGWAYAKKMTVDNAVTVSVKMLSRGILQESLAAAHAVDSAGDSDEVVQFDETVALQQVMARRVHDLRQKHGPVAKRLEQGGMGGARLSKTDWWDDVAAQSNSRALFDIRDYQKQSFKGRCVSP
jgi:hypothetical protein